MDGILIIDKPAGITSHDVVSHVRRVLKTKRVGHTGTLDPFATGVMVILVGKATRLAQYLDKDEKEYEAVVKFGFETDTGDATGNPKTKVQTTKSVSIDELKFILPPFRGETEQTPPMYSAKKVEGKKLYELARKGVEIEREAVTVNIHELELLPDSVSSPQSTVGMRVVCSAGTFIRTLAEDIGRSIGIGAHLTELRRTRAGKFSIGEAVSLNELSESDNPGRYLRPVREAVNQLPVFELRDDRVEKTKNGMSTRDFSGRFADRETVQMVAVDGELMAIGFFDATEKVVQPKVVLG